MRALNPLAAVLAFLLLAGCESAGMTDQTIAYNVAVADSTNEFFLLNVLRARDRFPVYYTRTTGTNTSRSMGGGVSTDVEGWHLIPTIGAVGSSGSTVTLANLDDQKFMRGVLTPVPLSTLGFYLDQGWPKEVVLEMFINSMEIDADFVTAMTTKFNERCDADPGRTYCGSRRPLDADGEPYPSPGTYVANSCLHAGANRAVLFKNDPSDKEDSLCFRAMLRVLVSLGLGVSTGDKYTVVAGAVPAASTHNLEALGQATNAKLVVEERSDGRYAVCKREDASSFTLGTDAFDAGAAEAGGFFDRPNVSTTSLGSTRPSSCAATAMMRAANTTAPIFRFTTRSLDTMIYYLGEDLRAGSSVTIWTGHHADRQTEIPLFLVERGAWGELVSLDYRGAHYAIPDQCAGDDTCEQSHRSLQVLSLLNQIWGLQKEASEAPSVPVVSVINAQ